MHIIQVSSYYPPHLGGQENAVQDLATRLAAAGHEVDVLTSAQGGMKGTTIENGVRVTRLSSFVFGHAPVMPNFLSKLGSLLRPNSVVHLHIGQAFTPEMVALLASLRDFRFIAELHIDFEPSGPAGFLLPLYKKAILKPVLHRAAKVAVLSEKIKANVERYYEIDDVQVVSNGVDEFFLTLDRSPLAQKPPALLHLLFVGRLSKQKNVACLLEAIAKTPQEVHLDIVGDGEEKTVLQSFVKQHHLTKKVTFHGRLDKQKVITFYQKNHALIMPSLYEAQPMVLLEAMAARVPIIGTTAVGVGEHIAGIGIVVEPTAKGLMEGIDTHYAQYSQLPTMIKKGHRKARSCSWPKLLKVYEKLYESSLAD